VSDSVNTDVFFSLRNPRPLTPRRESGSVKSKLYVTRRGGVGLPGGFQRRRTNRDDDEANIKTICTTAASTTVRGDDVGEQLPRMGCDGTMNLTSAIFVHRVSHYHNEQLQIRKLTVRCMRHNSDAAANDITSETLK